MSIQIGINAKNSSTSITNNERIFLQSTVHSNMISMMSSLSESRIVFNDDLTFGRSNTSFAFEKADAPFVKMNPLMMDVFSKMTVYDDVEIVENVTIQKYLHVQDTISTPTLNTNVTTISAQNTFPCFSILNQTNVPVYQSRLNNDGNLNTVTYGTLAVNKPQANYTVDVNGDIYASHRVFSECNITQKIQNNTSNAFIEMDNAFGDMTLRCTRLIVTGRIAPQGGIEESNREIDRLFIRIIGNAPALSLSNLTQTFPTISLLHNLTTSSTPCNVMEFNSYDGTTFPLLYMTPSGRVGLSTDKPVSQFDIHYNSKQGTSNLVYIRGDQSSNIVIDKNANVGIGTSTPLHILDIHRNADSCITSNAVIGIYNDVNGNVASPLLVAYSNVTPVVQISDHGRVTLGNIAYDSNWGLDVSSSLRVPYIQTNSLTGDPFNEKKIDLNASYLSNIDIIHGNNMTMTELTSTSNLKTNYFFSSNFHILGFKIFNTEQYFSIDMDTMLFKGSNAVFSSKQEDLYKDPITNGKVRIHVTDVNDSISMGLNVIGRSNTLSQITSGGDAIMRWSHSNVSTAAQTFMDMRMSTDCNFRILYNPLQGQENVNPAILINNDRVHIYKCLHVTSSGFVGMNLGTDTPTSPLHVRGVVAIEKDDGTKNALVYITPANNGRMGVNTANPTSTLHVQGDMRVTSTSYLQGSVGINTESSTQYNLYVHGNQYTSGNTIINGNIGIGTTNPREKLDVNGNINFTGSLFQNGKTFITSQWTTSNSTAPPYSIYILSSNVGIGTSSPATLLDVRGNVSVGNIGIGTTIARQSLHVQNNAFMNGNVGIGTLTPLAGLHVQSKNVIVMNGKVGVGTSILDPRFTLDVNGNINFGGSLYQRGSLYVSSQWTTNNQGAIFFQGNVGIGTSSPVTEFHVNNQSTFDKSAIFNSSVTVNGLLTTQGNIASISDQSVKTNLSRITDAIEKISKINGYTYERIDTGNRESGLIAQQVQQILPEVVHPIPDRNLLTISYGNMAGLFVEAIKELTHRIDMLEHELHQLRS